MQAKISPKRILHYDDRYNPEILLSNKRWDDSCRRWCILGYSVEMLEKFLKGKGYRFYLIERNGALTPVDRILYRRKHYLFIRWTHEDRDHN